MSLGSNSQTMPKSIKILKDERQELLILLCEHQFLISLAGILNAVGGKWTKFKVILVP